MNTLLLLLLLSHPPVGSGSPPPSLQSLVAAQDRAGISAFKASWEQGWEPDWQLVAARFADIDHFRPGIILEWRISSGSFIRERTDAFNLDGSFYSAHEAIRSGAREVQRGPMAITPDGRRTYRVVVFLGPTDMVLSRGFKTEAVRYYELHVFSGGVVQSRYCSDSNFTIVAGSLGRVPPDALLVSGPEVPEVEASREVR